MSDTVPQHTVFTDLPDNMALSAGFEGVSDFVLFVRSPSDIW